MSSGTERCAKIAGALLNLPAFPCFSAPAACHFLTAIRDTARRTIYCEVRHDFAKSLVFQARANERGRIAIGSAESAKNT